MRKNAVTDDGCEVPTFETMLVLENVVTSGVPEVVTLEMALTAASPTTHNCSRAECSRVMLPVNTLSEIVVLPPPFAAVKSV